MQAEARVLLLCPRFATAVFGWDGRKVWSWSIHTEKNRWKKNSLLLPER
jgi:hypothetical protein